jgi:hypothetical protein
MASREDKREVARQVPAYTCRFEQVEQGVLMLRVFRVYPATQKKEREVARLPMTQAFLGVIISAGLAWLNEQEQKRSEPAKLVTPEGGKLL